MAKVSVGSNGGFVIDGGTEVSLGTLLMQLNIDRTKTIDAQIADQMQEIQSRNEQLRALNELLAYMRTAREAKGDVDDKRPYDDNASGNSYSIGLTDANGNEMQKQTDDWFEYFGLTRTSRPSASAFHCH